MSAAVYIQPSRVAFAEVKSKGRRARIRFKLELDLSYSARGADGSAFRLGRTVDICSGGLLFKAGRDMAKDAEIHVSLAWPICLEDGVPLRLFIEGRVLRSHNGLTAVKVLRYNFRTARRQTDAE